jgi:hypothetical protein
MGEPMNKPMQDERVEYRWIIRCPACGSDLEVSEDDIKIDKKGRAYTTCYNNEGHKRHSPQMIVFSNYMLTSDPDLFNAVKKKRKESTDLTLVEINHSFDRLKMLMPNFEESLELMHVLCIRFHRLSKSEQMTKKEDIDTVLRESFDSVMKYIKG